jgi:hypothetical protein
MISFGKKNKDRKQSTGEVVFDRTVYTGIGFAANEVISLYIADELQHGYGKKYYDAMGHKLINLLNIKDIVKKGEFFTAKQRVDNTLVVGALLIGGTLLVLPMKWLEDSKSEWVKRINHFADRFKSNHLDDEQIKARDKEVEESIACQPKQSWTSLIIGRAAAVINNMLILSTTVFTKPVTSKIDDFSLKYITKGAEKVNKIVYSDRADSPISKIMQTRRFRDYSKLIAIETIYTAASSLVLEIVSKFTAKKNPQVQNPKLCSDLVQKNQTTEEKVTTESSLDPNQVITEASPSNRRGITPKKNFQDMATRSTDQPMQLGV